MLCAVISYKGSLRMWVMSILFIAKVTLWFNHIPPCYCGYACDCAWLPQPHVTRTILCGKISLVYSYIAIHQVALADKQHCATIQMLSYILRMPSAKSTMQVVIMDGEFVYIVCGSSQRNHPQEVCMCLCNEASKVHQVLGDVRTFLQSVIGFHRGCR